jgi:hypothetical protein
LVQQFAIGMQALPHGFCPAGHTHTPAEHTNPAAHCAEVQQLVLGMQLVPHTCCPDGHWHVPLTHVSPVTVVQSLQMPDVPHWLFAVPPTQVPPAAAVQQPLEHGLVDEQLLVHW